MKLKTLTPITLLASTLLLGASFTSVHAEDPVTANVSLATDYVWRGVSQTDQAPAIQGGFDWSNESGFYIGTWGSNVDFSDSSSLELDVYAGWETELSSGLGLDFGLIQYTYHDDGSDSDFTELYAGLSYSNFSGAVSRDFDNKTTYLEVGYDTTIGQDIGLGLHVGKYTSDYTDYSVTFSKSYAGLDFGLGYYDTNVDSYLTDGRFVLSVGKSL